MKEIKKAITTLLVQNKFKVSKKNSYIRITNRQLIQEINFQKSTNGKEFTINLGIIPLISLVEYPCIPSPNLRIGNLLYNYDKWWSYENIDVDEIFDIIEKIVKLLDELSSYQKIYLLFKDKISDIISKKASDSIIISINEIQVNIKYLYYCLKYSNLFLIFFYNHDFSKSYILYSNFKNQIILNAHESIERWKDLIRCTNDLKIHKKYLKILESEQNNLNDELSRFKKIDDIFENKKYSDFIEQLEKFELINIKKIEEYL